MADRTKFRIEKYLNEANMLESLINDNRAGLDITLRTWNDAISFEARIKRVIKATAEVMAEIGQPSPYAEVITSVVQPGIVRLRIGDPGNQMLIFPVNPQESPSS
jgi:hypothetical protein